MNNIPTPHITAEYGKIAKKVLMPGDPLRAKFIAEEYLQEVECFNTVRNMFGYTGIYKGKEVSVMGSGMGMPSIGIYSYELYKFYDVDSIIRIGSAGAFRDDVHVMDVVIAMGACTNSNFASQYKLNGTYAPIASYDLLSRAVEVANSQNKKVVVGNVLSSDTFYNDDDDASFSWKKMGVVCVEMEAAALYMNAARLNKKALAMFTISDHIYLDEVLTAQQRQLGFSNMIEIALEM
ncbi:purine-nucleoside phosphorylase [[Eubacterium] yurii]|jgi:purine nucleoside phosphorylase|nr:purine-nucleoside phosphorylase [[Eubacterium] yurii]